MLFDIFSKKKVLVTGHTGFKGSWLSLWLRAAGADVYGLSDRIPTMPSNFRSLNLHDIVTSYMVDIRDRHALEKTVFDVNPDFVFHLAAQSLVRTSFASPAETMEVNAIGSVNLLSAVSKLDKDVVVVMVTSDKAYENVEWVWGYRETDRLGGKDPYSSSKGMAELAIRSFITSFLNEVDPSIKVGVARAGNVIGGGDWAADRIIPDCVRAWSTGERASIRNPNSTRPWQHVLEPLSGYLVLASNLAASAINHGEAYNFGPSSDSNYSVQDLIRKMANHWDRVEWCYASSTEPETQEAGLLKLNCDKALSNLNWTAALDFDQTVKMTAEWYKYYYEEMPLDMNAFAHAQLSEYLEIAKSRQIMWALND